MGSTPTPSGDSSSASGKFITLAVALAVVTGGYFIYMDQMARRELGEVPYKPYTTIVEEEPPMVMPEEVIAPRAIPRPAREVPVATATPPPKPDAVAWLRERRERWPREVAMTQAQTFPAKLNNRIVGQVKVPAGARVSLVLIEQKTLVASFNGATTRIPIESTDLGARALTEMANPEPAAQTVAATMAARGATPAPGPKPLPGTDGKWKDLFAAGKRPLGQLLAPATPRPNTGKVTYTLHRPKDESEELRRINDGIQNAMDAAVAFYNRHTSLKKHLNVRYSAGTPTADANFDGNIRLGGQRNTRTCLHEMGHCFGAGTHPKWGALMVKGRWQGNRANELLQGFTNNKDAQLHGDHMHFWPYGLNYDAEAKSDEDMIRHAILVEAMVEDMER